MNKESRKGTGLVHIYSGDGKGKTTAGMGLCVRAAGWSDGDRVITTPFSFVSSTNVLLYERITPIFVDAEPLTGNIDTVLLKCVHVLLPQDRAASCRDDQAVLRRQHADHL